MSLKHEQVIEQIKNLETMTDEEMEDLDIFFDELMDKPESTTDELIRLGKKKLNSVEQYQLEVILEENSSNLLVPEGKRGVSKLKLVLISLSIEPLKEDAELSPFLKLKKDFNTIFQKYKLLSSKKKEFIFPVVSFLTKEELESISYKKLSSYIKKICENPEDPMSYRFSPEFSVSPSELLYLPILVKESLEEDGFLEKFYNLNDKKRSAILDDINENLSNENYKVHAELISDVFSMISSEKTLSLFYGINHLMEKLYSENTPAPKFSVYRKDEGVYVDILGEERGEEPNVLCNLSVDAKSTKTQMDILNELKNFIERENLGKLEYEDDFVMNFVSLFTKNLHS